jgi:hypothetical protein
MGLNLAEVRKYRSLRNIYDHFPLLLLLFFLFIDVEFGSLHYVSFLFVLFIDL